MIENKEKSRNPQKVPISVNLRVNTECNYRCRFCFGKHKRLKTTPNDSRILEIPGLLADAGCEKLTFEGGEPLLHLCINDLVKTAKSAGLRTGLITNGSRMTFRQLCELKDHLDIITISVDSPYERVEKCLGRGFGNHIKNAVQISEWAYGLGIELKVNSVVTKLNWKDDLTALLRIMRPQHYKALQVLPAKGENDKWFERLRITKQQFNTFVKRHRVLESEGIRILAENNDDMTDSYIMMLPDGRFFDYHGGRYNYSTKSIFDIGVRNAFGTYRWDYQKFCRRDALYFKEKSEHRSGEVISTGKSKMSSKSASRIQSHADKTRTNQGFKARAQAAAAKNSNK